MLIVIPSSSRYVIAKLCLLIAAALAVITFLAISELPYTLFGKYASAKITHLESAPIVSSTAIVVTYAFQDNDQQRTETHLFEDNPPPLDNPTIDIIYIPNKPNYSKPLISRHLWTVPVFLTLFTAFIITASLWLYGIYKEPD